MSGYHFYFGEELLPVAPAKLNTKIKNKNKTITLVNEGEVNLLKQTGLTDYKFDILLPNVLYPFAEYLNGFKRADYYLDLLEKLKVNKTPFQFIVNRFLPNGTVLFKNNVTVTLEEYEIKEDAANGFDVIVSVELKMYKPFQTRVVTIEEEKVVRIKAVKRTTKKQASGTTYTVKKGDCLCSIAKAQYGDGSKYTKIYDANKKVIEAAAQKNRKGSSQNGRYIYPGTVLKIP